MSTPDFAAAQARILARRAATTTTTTHSASTPSIVPSLPPALLLSLPAPLRSLLASSLLLLPSSTTRPTFRVGQVDAELLDAELLSLFQGQVRDALRLVGGHIADDWAVEIVAALRAALWKFSIWDRGVSYGARLQGLKYVDARSGGRPRGWQRVAYGAVTVGGRYGWEKWEDWLLDREGRGDGWVRRAGRVTRWIGAGHDVAAFVGFLVFLYNGRYRTLVDRVLRLRLVPSAAQTTREVSFEYLNRQLVWHAFTEFLLFILPLVGISRWRRWLARAWRKVKSTVTRSRDDDDDHVARGELGFLPERTCAICYKDQNPTGGASEADVLAASSGGGGVIGSAQTDVTNPYEALPCGDVYCFSCLALRIEAEDGEGWTCLRCGEVVKECKPWSGDVIEETTSRSTSGSKGSRKSVVFADAEEEEDLLEVEDPIERALTPVEPMPFEDEMEHGEAPSDRDTVDDEAEAAGASSGWIGYGDVDHEEEVDIASDMSGSEAEEAED